MKKVLVTGANGFIGLTLTQELIAADFEVLGAVRNLSPEVPYTEIKIADIDAHTDWHKALDGVDTVIHLAARVHVMQETASNPDTLFGDVNLDGTVNLAQQAVNAGVRRFIYLSTIKVNGEGSDTVMCSKAQATPNDAYANSKWNAEQSLNNIALNNPLEVVIIRPPLVYGPSVKGNFLRLLHLVQNNKLIPFGSVNNKRSMVYVGNLCHLIKTCITHPNAAGGVFLVSDNHDLSTPELIKFISGNFKRSAIVISVPVIILSGLAKLIGKDAEMQRLCGSLQVDISQTMFLLDWQPPYQVQHGLKKTVDWFLLAKSGNTT